MIRIIGNRVLVKRLESPDTSKGGLFVLGREKPNMGIVVAVGNGPRQGRGGRGERLPIDDIEVGDEVTFDKWAGESAHVDDEHMIIDYDQLFLRIRK